jgi:hypothetical protein
VIGHMLPFVKKCSVEHIERSGGGGQFFYSSNLCGCMAAKLRPSRDP